MSDHVSKSLLGRDAGVAYADDPASSRIGALELLRFSPERLAAAVGDVSVIPRPDLDLTLHPSREAPMAGELWSIAGEIHNRSQVPIWIVDQTTCVTLAPEMYGSSRRTRSMSAFFPTTRGGQGAEVVRIDPGASYAVVWELDPLETKGENRRRSSLRRTLTTIRDFAFFKPGRFRVSSTVHVWQQKPELDADGAVSNTGASYPITVSTDLAMDTSPWVLIAGSAFGSILALVLQLLNGQIRLGGPGTQAFRDGWVELGTALILTCVGTVLVSRLATTDFIVVVKIRDVWGAIATGFAIQSFAYPGLQRLLERLG